MEWISLIVGGVFATLSIVDSVYKGKEDAEARTRAEAEKKRQKDAALEMLDLSYETEKKQADKAADNMNKDASFGEVMLGNEINGALDKIGLGQEARTLAYNEANMNSDSKAGAANQQLATSGTKGSSSAQAVQMQQDLDQQKLQHQEDIDRKQDEINLESAMNVMQQGTYNIQKQRTAANDLLTSYKEGGDAYKMYQSKRNNIEAGYNYELNELSEAKDMATYNAWMGGATNAVNAFGSGIKFYDTTKEVFDYL